MNVWLGSLGLGSSGGSGCGRFSRGAADLRYGMLSICVPLYPGVAVVVRSILLGRPRIR